DDVGWFAVVDESDSRVIGNLNRGARVTPEAEVAVQLQENVDTIGLRELRQSPKTFSDVIDALVALDVSGEVVAKDANALAAKIAGELDEVLGAVDDSLSLVEIG